MTRVSGALRLFWVLTGMLVALSVVAPSASAHDPIFITADQTTPDTGPYMPDGTISWALYGSVLAEGDTRGFEFDLRDGDELYVSLLIPNLTPEVDLEQSMLPTLELQQPDGTTRTIVADRREIFDEPFSNTSYVTLTELREPGQGGRYRGVVIGAAPARFTVAIGETEIFFTETERSGERPTNFLEISEPLNAWYSTPPGGEPIAATGDGEAEIQLDLIEEAMDAGVAEAPEESLAMSDDEGQEEAAADGTAGEDEAVEAEPPPAPEPEVPEAEPEPDDGAEGESASATVTSTDEGSGATWIAPVAIGAVVVAGAGALAVRSRRGRAEAQE